MSYGYVIADSTGDPCCFPAGRTTMSTYLGVVIDHEKLFPIEWYPEDAFVCPKHGIRKEESWVCCPECGNPFLRPVEDKDEWSPPGRIVPNHPIIDDFFEGQYLQLFQVTDRETAIFSLLDQIQADEYNYLKAGIEPNVPLMFVVILGPHEEYKHVILGVDVDDLTSGYHLGQDRIDEVIGKIRDWHAKNFGSDPGNSGLFWSGD